METRSLPVAFMAFPALTSGACSGNKKSGVRQVAEAPGPVVPGIDDIPADAGSLTGKEVALRGICAHACRHGASMIFLMGSDDTMSIRVEACRSGSFYGKCVNPAVEVKGKVPNDYGDRGGTEPLAETHPHFILIALIQQGHYECSPRQRRHPLCT